jgi:hypothetical protein
MPLHIKVLLYLPQGLRKSEMKEALGCGSAVQRESVFK